MSREGELMPAGRPSRYNERTAFVICGRLAKGQSMREICRDSHMPSAGTVYRWLSVNEEFQEQYARARKAQADTIFEEILDIADDAKNDWMKRQGGDGQEQWVMNGEHVQRSRLRIDARKWMLGKMNPKKYGDKQEVEHSGNLNVTSIERNIVRPNS